MPLATANPRKWSLLRLVQFTVAGIELQGVVTYMSPVEAFATGIKNLDRQKSALIA